MTTIEAGATTTAAPRWRPNPVTVLLWLMALIVGGALAIPLVVLVMQSFTVPGANHATLTLVNYYGVIFSRTTYLVVANTIGFCLALTIVSGSLGFFFAWIAARTDAPLRRYMATTILLPYFVPPIVGAIAWILLLNPSNGAINQLLIAVFGIKFDIYSFAGMVFVESLYAFPLSFTFFYASLVSLNPTLEEASSVAGASIWGTLRHTTIPSIWPTFMSVGALLFILGIESFDVAWFIGYPARIYTLSTQIFLLTLNEYPPKYGMAAVYGIITMALAFFLVRSYRKVTHHGERYTTITGKGYRSGQLRIGWVGIVASIVFYLLIALIGLLPLLLLACISVDAIGWPLHFAGTVSFAHYAAIFSDPTAQRGFVNTAILAFGGAFLVVLLSFIITFLTTRTNEFGRGILDYLAFLPIGLPGVVLALGIVLALVSTPIYNTMWVLLFAYVLKFIPFGLRNLSSSMLQIDKELEEASMTSGATALGTLRRILLPLAMPGILAAWSLVFIVFVRQFSLPAMLSSVDTNVVTIQLYQDWEGGNVGNVAAYSVLIVLASMPFLALARRVLGGNQAM